jgi:hypothetical protein
LHLGPRKNEGIAEGVSHSLYRLVNVRDSIISGNPVVNNISCCVCTSVIYNKYFIRTRIAHLTAKRTKASTQILCSIIRTNGYGKIRHDNTRSGRLNIFL